MFFRALRDSEITLDDVEQVLNHFSTLQPAPDREMTNPFSGAAFVAPGIGKAIFVDEGEPAGNFSLEEGQLLFTGVPQSVALEVAQFIGATLEEWDNS